MNATPKTAFECATLDRELNPTRGDVALIETVRFYDHLRAYEYDAHSEQGARVQAELYLRRKIPGLGANDAAVMLADALALRAAARVNP
jgi:hypothetical protein